MSLGAAGGGTGSGSGGDLRLFFFENAALHFGGGVSDSADAACLRSVPFIAAGDSDK